MITRYEFDQQLFVTDNFLTNMPISKLSSIPAYTGALGPGDLMLISKPCDPSDMTETGYMSYQAPLDRLSSWMYDTLGIDGIKLDISRLSDDLGRLLPYEPWMQKVSQSSVSAFVEIYRNGKFDPAIISAIYAEEGVLLEQLGVYRFSDAMENIFAWKKFRQVSATNGYFDNLRTSSINATTVNATTVNATTVNATDVNATRANITNLTVDGRPYNFLSVMTDTAYKGLSNANKNQKYFYFTY